MLMALEWSRFSPDWYEWLIGRYCNSLANQLQTSLKFRNGSISEVITLNTPCSGDERKAEPICCLISGVFSSQFGQNRKFAHPKMTPAISDRGHSTRGVPQHFPAHN